MVPLPAAICSLLLLLPSFADATVCTRSRGSYCPVGLDCNKNNSLCESKTCSDAGANRTYYNEGTFLQGSNCSSNLPICKPLQENKEVIQNFSDPLVVGAVCAAIDQINVKSTSAYKFVLVTITNGTRQVAKGLRFDLFIIVALSTTCLRDSQSCTSGVCVIDESTKHLWMATIVAPPTLSDQPIKYNVLSFKEIAHVGLARVEEINELDIFLCSICQNLVKYLESHLDTTISRKAVKEALNNACVISKSVKSCLDFVHKYFEDIWNAVIHKTLGKFCCKFQFCACEKNAIEFIKGSMNDSYTVGRDGLCPEGFYCLAGDDCNSNSSLCEIGVCQVPLEENCKNQGITIQFSLDKYEAKESNNLVQPVLILSRPLKYCSFSVQIKVEDGTAIGNDDYHFPSGGYMQVIISGGIDTVPINIAVKDDNIVEKVENFWLTIVDISLPCGVTVGSTQRAAVVILDDDSSCVRFDRQAYTIREGGNSLQVGLAINQRASYDFNVNVYSVYLNASRYDYSPGPYRVTFRAVNQRATLRINITDDDMHEGPESFGLYIDGFLPDQVSRCEPYRSVVTIIDDDQNIYVSFDQSTFIMNENDGELSPILTLDKPSPCCLNIYAELTDVTATGGGVDYGYPLPIIYEFTFLAGETCATSVDPIPIIDDRISERQESFRISVMQLSLPLGVQTRRSYTTINIVDNDIACEFDSAAYKVDANDGRLQIKLKLDRPATTEFNMQVYDVNNTAIANEDYTPGPYYVTFKKWSRTSDFFISITKDGDDVYTGDKVFNLTIYDDKLPPGLVPGNIISTKVTILDDEYIVCFNQPTATVIEGGRLDLALSTSRRLSRSVRVPLIYSNGTGYPATPSPAPRGAEVDYLPVSLTYVYSSRKFFISTRSDRTLEYNETFAVSIHPDLIHSDPAAAHCITKVDVLILNNDVTTVDFQSTSYSSSNNKNEPLRPVIELSNPISFPIQVALQVEDGTAKNGEDYIFQNKYSMIINPEDRQRKQLSIDIIDDDMVEMLTEEFYINITHIANGDGIPVDGLRIGKDRRTKLLIKDDDRCEIRLNVREVRFSNPLYVDIRVAIVFRTGVTGVDYMLKAGEYSVEYYPRRYDEIRTVYAYVPSSLRSSVRENHSKILIIWV